MLEHPEIGWMERTGYPSWLQEREEIFARSEKDGAVQIPVGIRLLRAAEAHQRLRPVLLSAPASGGGENSGVSPG